MKYQFRAVPPNGDIVLDNAKQGYEAGDASGAWMKLCNKLGLNYDETKHIRQRYILEPFGTIPSL